MFPVRITPEILWEAPETIGTVRQRHMGLAGHCVRHPELTASQLILWEGSLEAGHRQHTLNTLKRGVGLDGVAEIQALIEDREQWRAAVRNSRVVVT